MPAGRSRHPRYVELKSKVAKTAVSFSRAATLTGSDAHQCVAWQRLRFLSAVRPARRTPRSTTMSTRPAESIEAPVAVAVPPSVPIPLEAQETAARLGVLQHLPRVIDLTREIFGSFSQVTLSEDPDAGDAHVLFHVPAKGSVEEVLDREEKWGRRMMEIIPRSPQVYLVFSEFPS
jgi:hypothetical protein